MNILSTAIIIIPSILSLCVSGIYAYIALRKAREPQKDEIWETALKLMCAKDDCYSSADDFVKLYRELKFFKDHPEKIEGFTMIETAMESYSKEHLNTVSDQNVEH